MTSLAQTARVLSLRTNFLFAIAFSSFFKYVWSFSFDGLSNAHGYTSIVLVKGRFANPPKSHTLVLAIFFKLLTQRL